MAKPFPLDLIFAKEALRAGGGLALSGGVILALQDPVIETSTSGSTGPAPKILRRSIASWEASFAVNRARFSYHSEDIFAHFGAPKASIGLYTLFEAVRAQAGLVLNAADLAAATILHATPTQLRQFLARARSPLPRLRLILAGGGALDAATRSALQSLAPQAQIHAYFGAAETSFITMTEADTPEGSVGRPYPNVELALLPLAGQDPDKSSNFGEIAVASPYLFDGYLAGTDPLTRTAPLPSGARGLAFGEVGRRDGQGNLWLLGRVNRMFTVADQNLFPEALEAWLMAQEGVLHAAILPRPDALREAVPVGFYCVKSEACADPDALLAKARAEFGPLLAPRRLTEVCDWPLLPSGKTDLRALQNRPDDA